MAPRAIWSGAISFGLVTIPVKLYGSVKSKSVSFKGLEAGTLVPRKQQFVSAVSGELVGPKETVKAFELSKGKFVVVEDDELKALLPKQQHTIDIAEFVDADSLDATLFDTTYIAAPDKIVKPYRLLVDALAESGKVGIARFVMRTKQYVVALRARDGRLEVSTLVYADEVNDPAAISELAEVAAAEVTDAEKAMALKLVESLSVEAFDADKYVDEYRVAVLALVEAKASGQEVPVVEIAPEPEALDLLAALEASLAA